MSTLHMPTSCEVVTRVLNPEASARVLVSAARLQSLVHLFRTTDSQHPVLEATLIGCEDDALCMRLINKRDEGATTTTALRARLMDTPTCFHFETRLLDPLPRSASNTMRLSRPESLYMEERRAAARRYFHDEITVNLWGISGMLNQPCAAVLLNFCAGGLACRVTGAKCNSITTGTTVRLAFNPDAAPTGDINVAARIVSVTAAADPEVVILGLEFDTESLVNADQQRIAAAIARP